MQKIICVLTLLILTACTLPAHKKSNFPDQQFLIKANETKILITGYKPFRGLKENISEKVVENISGSIPSIIPLIMPVEWQPVRTMLSDTISKEKPDIIIGLGYKENAETLWLEPVLLNRSDHIKDEAGKFPPTPYIIEGEPEQHTVNLPLKRLAKYLNENGVPVIINENPSSMTFLCGYAAYLERYYADKYCAKNTITIFIHLPPPHKTDFNTAVKGIKLVINFLSGLKSGLKEIEKNFKKKGLK